MTDINATFDEKKPFKTRRLALMSDEQQKLATKIQDWYRAAYRDKDNRGVFEDMEAAEMYWEGDANAPESDYDPASNTNIVNSTIEGMVAYLVQQNLAVEAKPRGPSDLPFRDKAVNLMQWCMELNKMRRKMDVHERRRKKFGVGYFRVLFDPDLLDGMGLPWIEAVNPAYLLPDPVVTDIYKTNEGRFMIELLNRSIDSACENFGDEYAEAIEPGYVPMEYEDIFGEFEDADTEIAHDHYLHWLVWTHAWVDDEPEPVEEISSDEFVPETDDNLEGDAETKKHKGYKNKKQILRLIEMSACGVILRDTLADNVIICENDQRYPYFPTPDMFREGSVWPKSTAELLIPVQNKIDDLDDQIMINARLTGNPQRIVDSGSGIDPDKIDNGGGLIMISSYEGGIKYLAPPEMAHYVIQHRDKALGYERTVVSRWSDQMNGIKQQGVDTATESLGLQQSGTQAITHDQILLEETLGEIFEYCLILMMENYTEDEIFRVTKQTGEDSFMPLNPSSMLNIPKLIPAHDSYKRNFAAEFPAAENVPEWMPHPEGLTQKIALDIKVTVGAGLPSNKAFVYQMIEKAAQRGTITPPEDRKLMKEYIGLPIAEQPEMPPQQQIPGMPGAGGPMQNPAIAGLTGGGSPMAPGGVL